MAGFETGSDNKRIDELEEQLSNIIDSQLNAVGGNDNVQIDSTRGSRNDAGGDAGGVRSNEPIIHQITDVDESGTPTGIFDKINLISSMIIVDFSTPTVDMELRFIQGPAKDGAKIKITPKKGRTLVIKSGGTILTSDDITIEDTEFYELVKHSEVETGISGGAYKIFKIDAGGGNVPDPTAEFQHLQSDGSNNWIAQQELSFGADSSSVGEIRLPNDTIGISWKNAANDNDIGIKVDANDKFLFNIGTGNIVLEIGTGEIDFKTLDAVNIDRLTFIADSLAPTSPDVPQIYVGGGVGQAHLIFNNKANDEFIWTSDNIIKMILTDSTLEKRNVTAPNFNLNNTRVAATGTVGTFSFIANTTTLSGVNMAFIIGDTENEVGVGSGGLKLGVNLNGIPTLFLTMNDSNDGNVKFSKNLDLNTNYLQLESITSPGVTGSASTGRMFMDSDNSNHLSIIRNGGVIDLESASQTPILQNVDYDDFNIFDISRISQNGIVPTSGFINMANSAGLSWEASPAGTDGILTYSASEHFTFISSAGSSVLGANGQSLGLSGLRWGTLFVNAVDVASGGLIVTGNSLLQGDIFLGNSSSDEISATGRWVSSLIPSNDNSIDLGSTTLEWRDLFIDGTAHIDILDVDSTSTFTNTATFNGEGIFNDDLTIGSSSADNWFINAQLNSSIIPDTTSIDLGSSIDRFRDIYLQAGFNTSQLFFDGGSDTYLTGSGTSGRINVVSDGANTIAFTTTALFLTNGINISVGTGTGTEIATSATQKLGFFGATPIVRPPTPAANSAAIIATLQSLGLFT